MTVAEALKTLTDEEAAKLVNDDEIKAKALAAVEQNGIVFLDEIDKIASRAGDARRRRLAPGRAARPAAARRRHDRVDQVRDGAHRPHPVHRVGRVPPLEAVGPHSRAAGALSDPRRARNRCRSPTSRRS